MGHSTVRVIRLFVVLKLVLLLLNIIILKNIFIIGEQRSGSNLLRLILNNHSEIAAPHPPHILKRFTPIMDCFGDINLNENIDYLIENVCELVDRNPISWGEKLDRSLVKEQLTERSLIGVFDAVMKLFCQSHSASMGICKSLHNVFFYKEIERYYNAPKYIYLHRDPRDVAASFKKAVVGEKHVYCIAKRWKQLQEKCLELKKQIPQDRFYTISYEALIKDPSFELAKLCVFLNFKFDTKLLEFYHTIDAINASFASSLWENLKMPVMKNNFGKYLNELSEDEVLIIEKITCNTMQKLGYSLVNDSQLLLEEFTKPEIAMFNELNEISKLKMRKSLPKLDRQARQYQLDVLKVFKGVQRV